MESSHWVEELFPAQYSISDYRATFQQRIRRYITTLSTFDGPTLAAIYEQSYLFTLIQRLAAEDAEPTSTKNKSRANQTEPVDSVLDIRLIRSFLEKHKEKVDEEKTSDDELWSSDEISIIRSAYLKVRDDFLRLKSENEFFRNETTKLRDEIDRTNEILQQLRDEHFQLKKTNERWKIRATAAEENLREQQRENDEFREHAQKLKEENENLRRNRDQFQREFFEKKTRLEQLEKKIEHYDETLKRDCDRRLELMGKRVEIDKERLKIEKTQLQTQLDKEQNLRRQNLLALDQLRKHVDLSKSNHDDSQCQIKNVKFA